VPPEIGFVSKTSNELSTTWGLSTGFDLALFFEVFVEAIGPGGFVPSIGILTGAPHGAANQENAP
jgi:hypothetical protein